MSEQVSAFLDGEMEHTQLDKRIQKLLSDKHAVRAYREYQQIGEALRGQSHDQAEHRLTEAVMASIDKEPTILSPNAIPAVAVEQASRSKSQVAPAWSIAASVAAVMVVGLFSWQQSTTNVPSLAQAQPLPAPLQLVKQVAVANQSASTGRIPQAYLEAHRVSAPSAASHYIQTVNFSE